MQRIIRLLKWTLRKLEPIPPREKSDYEKQEKPDEPSDHFNSAFCSSGSLVIDCEHCGRTFFGSGGDYGEGELEGLREKASKEPEKYIEGYDFWSWYYIGGRQFVVGCPCNTAGKYEQFVWNNRHKISSYLKRRSDAELKQAVWDHEQVSRNLQPTA